MSGPPIGFGLGVWDDGQFEPEKKVRMPSKHEAAALGVWNDSAKNRVLAKRSKEARKRLLTNIYFWTSVIETHVVLWAYVHGLRSSLMLGVVLASILALFGAFQLRRRRGHPVDNHDLALFENVDDADYCLVDLEIWMSTKRIGVDRGVCWFEDNCLMFCGYNCSFSLGGQDVVKPSMLRLYLMISEFGNRRDSALPLLSHDGKPWITLTAIDSGRHVTWTACDASRRTSKYSRITHPKRTVQGSTLR